MKLNAKELRTTKPTIAQFKKVKKNPIYIIVDNVLDTYNVGAIFRLADAVAAEKVILCGQTETPPHTRIKKASINTTEWVAWEYAETTTQAILKLKEEMPHIQIIAVEQDEKSVEYNNFEYNFPLALVVGHESDGVSEDVLKLVDEIVELPMYGVNKSLNVMVSLGIVLFQAIQALP